MNESVALEEDEKGVESIQTREELKKLDGKERFKRGVNLGERRWVLRDGARKRAEAEAVSLSNWSVERSTIW